MASLEAAHQQLLARRVEAVEYGEPDALSPQKRAAANCQLLQQSLLHRAEHLLASSGATLVEDNVYGLALIVRGHLETTAVLGYFCSRLDSLAAGWISFDDFQWNVAGAMMGAKHNLFSLAMPPLNVLTCIEKADKFLDTHLFKTKRGVIQDCYNWLSEYAHPNFLSTISAFTFDEPNHRFILRHGHDAPQQEDFQLPVYLDISSKLFVNLFDAFAQKAIDGGLNWPVSGPI